MDFKQSLEILIQLADLAQAKGILTLDDAVSVKLAKDVAKKAIEELDQPQVEELTDKKEENDTE